jgi:hypothetical protein
VNKLLPSACLLLLASTAAAETPSPITGPGVYDSVGGFMGPIVDLYDSFDRGGATILMKSSVATFSVHVNSAGYYADSGELIPYFQSVDCTGTPFFENDSSVNEFRHAMVTPGTVDSPGRTVYTPVASSTVTSNFAYASHRTAAGCVTGNGTLQGAIHGVRAGNLTGVYKPPFSVH